MTFFANSGVAWPKFEQETREAGTESLDAASRIWKILAALEDRDGRNVEREEFTKCAKSLQHASDIYNKVAIELRYEKVASITPAELDLAALHHPYYDGNIFFYKMFIEDSDISVGRLYDELAQRTAHLAASIRAFEVERDNADLAPQAFQLMKQWEILAVLGRVVAVLNRRQMRHG